MKIQRITAKAITIRLDWIETKAWGYYGEHGNTRRDIRRRADGVGRGKNRPTIRIHDHEGDHLETRIIGPLTYAREGGAG